MTLCAQVEVFETEEEAVEAVLLNPALLQVRSGQRTSGWLEGWLRARSLAKVK